MGNENVSDAAAIIAGVERLSKKPEILRIENLDGSDVEVIAVPDGNGKFTIQTTRLLLDTTSIGHRPKDGTAIVTRVASFIDHVNMFKGVSSVVFAEVERPDPFLLAMLDYHNKSTGDLEFGSRHRTLYKFPISRQLKDWRSVDGKGISLAVFAKFIEAHLGDIFPPDQSALDDRIKEFAVNNRVSLGNSSELYDLAHGIQINVRNEVSQVVRTSSGEGSISFKETHTGADGGAVRFPTGFCIAIPLFQDGPLYQVPVRLSYDWEKGKGVTWMMEMFDLDLVVRDAVDEVCETVKNGTTLPLLYGAPEA